MSLHNEIKFEEEICEHLGANGWIYAGGDADLHCRHYQIDVRNINPNQGV